METTIIYGLYRGYIWIMLGLYKDNGKENGNYYDGLYRGYIQWHFKALSLAQRGLNISEAWGLRFRV